jgi:hypothetical protein
MVVVWVDGQKQALTIYANKVIIKNIPIKGLQNRTIVFQEYLELICKEAISVWRQTQRRATIYR